MLSTHVINTCYQTHVINLNYQSIRSNYSINTLYHHNTLTLLTLTSTTRFALYLYPISLVHLYNHNQDHDQADSHLICAGERVISAMKAKEIVMAHMDVMEIINAFTTGSLTFELPQIHFFGLPNHHEHPFLLTPPPPPPNPPPNPPSLCSCSC